MEHCYKSRACVSNNVGSTPMAVGFVLGPVFACCVRREQTPPQPPLPRYFSWSSEAWCFYPLHPFYYWPSTLLPDAMAAASFQHLLLVTVFPFDAQDWAKANTFYSFFTVHCCYGYRFRWLKLLSNLWRCGLEIRKEKKTFCPPLHSFKRKPQPVLVCLCPDRPWINLFDYKSPPKCCPSMATVDWLKQVKDEHSGDIFKGLPYEHSCGFVCVVLGSILLQATLY